MDELIDKSQYRRRVFDKTLERYLRIIGGVCVDGPKRCGKTWTASFYSNSVFLVDNPLNNYSNKQLAEISLSFILQGDTPRLIDEWQNVQGIWDKARMEIDYRAKRGQFIFTGSWTPKFKGIMHSGIGRITTIRMNTMSLFDSGDSSGKISLEELCNGHLTMQLLEDVSLEKLAGYIVRGGWPENIGVDSSKAHLMPQSYMNKVIWESLNNLDGGFEYNKHKMQILLRSLARNESTTISELAILKDIVKHEHESMSRNTISKYLDALKRIFLFNNQESFFPNFRHFRVMKTDKKHFSDPSLVCAILNITPDKLMKDFTTFSVLFESLVVHDLAIYAQAFRANLYHYQDYKNNKIDAVIELEDGEWCAFEIKLGANRIDEGAENLIKASNDIVKNGGKAPKIMCVICGLANAAYQRRDGVFVVPITALKD